MSHTGRAAYRNFRLRNTDTGYPDDSKKPRQVTVDEVIKNGKLDGEQITGEFQGNGTVVLLGMSTGSVLEPDEGVLQDNEKGVIIGFTEMSNYFSIYRNDGTGPMVTSTISNKLKDNELHRFEITIKSGSVSVKFDGDENTFTTRIPTINDSLKLVNYGVY